MVKFVAIVLLFFSFFLFYVWKCKSVCACLGVISVLLLFAESNCHFTHYYISGLGEILKLVSACFDQILIFSPDDSPLKTVKNDFYFI